MSGMIRSVEEIVDISESKNTPNRMAYKYVVKQVDKMVRARAVDQQYDAVFEVPAMVLYQPYFERDVVAKKVVRHYRRIGFKCDMKGFQIVLKWAKNVESESESESDSENEVNESGLYNSPNGDSSSEDEKLPPPRKIVVEKSLSQRVASMKNPSNNNL